jgi:hypothetical protein
MVGEPAEVVLRRVSRPDRDGRYGLGSEVGAAIGAVLLMASFEEAMPGVVLLSLGSLKMSSPCSQFVPHGLHRM